MSNDLGKKVQQIAQMLDQEDLPDNMKELVALLASSLSKKEPSSDSSGDKAAGEGDVSQHGDKAAGEGDVSQQEYREGDVFAQKASQGVSSSDKSSNSESGVNPEILRTAMKAMDRIKSANDPRINLLQAIKPFMNTRRQQKIGNCIQLLQLAGLSRFLNDREK